MFDINKFIRSHKEQFIMFCIVGGLFIILNYVVFFVLFQFLKYNYYQGWRAFQNNNFLEIKDCKPGMRIKVVNNGTVKVKYNYKYYWI